VLPLKNALKGYSAWATGLRRDQSPLRAKVPIVSWDKQHELVKIAPFATWTEDMIWLYMNTYDLPYNKLHDQGYPSIGCWPCTNPVQEGQDTRAGRWAGTRKTECGIHFSSIGAGVMG
jgi:phosphoadenosine phosphosulfate reductase